jgi:hypothetical protein
MRILTMLTVAFVLAVSWSAAEAALEQQWDIEIRGDRITLKSQTQSQGADLCADVFGGTFKAGTTVQIFGCNQVSSQIWVPGEGVVEKVGNATSNAVAAVVVSFQIAADTGLCMDVSGGNSTPGTNFQVWNCNNSPGQSWFLKN